MRRAVLLLIFGLSACDCGTCPDLAGFVELSIPDNRVPHSALYRQLWRDVEQCSGYRGDFDRVRFFWHPAEDSPIKTSRGQRPASAHHATYIIRLGRTSASDSRLVGHEMLHLLGGPHADSHPPELGERCKSLRLEWRDS